MMPSALLRTCSTPRCPNLTNQGKCDDCARVSNRRGESAAWKDWYSDRRWRAARGIFLRAHPLCIDCQSEGNVEPSTVVDHEPPHRGDRRKFWDRSTWRAICKPHHDRKTAREVGLGGAHA